jgi:hypothetical protein
MADWNPWRAPYAARLFTRMEITGKRGSLRPKKQLTRSIFVRKRCNPLLYAGAFGSFRHSLGHCMFLDRHVRTSFLLAAAAAFSVHCTR